MKNLLNRIMEHRKAISLFCILVVITGVCALFSTRKAGMFVDEIYTYGLSNGYYTPFVKSIPGGDMTNQVITQQQLSDYLTVGDDDRFAFGSVYYNQTQDVHPPLYYWLFNIASSLVPGVLSKWTGLALDYIIYMFTLFVLYKLAKRLFRSTDLALIAAALYGLSTVGVSTMLMIRMYVLMTLWSVTLAYLIIRLMEQPKPVLYPLIGLTILAGLLTQYYSVFYAFFLCAAYVLWAIIKKRWKQLIPFCLCAFAGVGLLLVIFPACLDQLFANALVSGGSAMDNLKNVGQYAERLRIYWDKPNRGLVIELRAALFAGLAALIACIPCGRKIAAGFRSGAMDCRPLFILLPAVFTYILVAIVAPVPAHRYIFNIMPQLVLICVWPFKGLETALDSSHIQWKDLWKEITVIAVACWALWMVRTIPPEYIYSEHAEYNTLVSEYSSSPCIYFTENSNGPVTQDLLQLIRFDDFLVSDDPAGDTVANYINGHSDNDRLVVYIDISESWGTGYDANEIINGLLAATDYSQAEELYQYELSDTFVLSK